MSDKYFCDCPRYCGGTLRELSRSTYFTHAPYRRARIRDALNNFLAHSLDPGPRPHEEAADNNGDDNNPNVLPDDNHDDDFDELYADVMPVLPPQANVAQLDDIEDLYVDPLPHEDLDEDGRDALDGNAMYAVGFV